MTGQKPDETDYTGNPHGNLGQAATQTGGVIFRPGKFGKGVQIAEATTNTIINPSFEVDVTNGWTVSGGMTATRDSAQSLYGSYSAKLVASNPGSYSRFYTTSNTVRTGSMTVSVWVYSSTAQTAAFRIATVPLDQSWQNLVAGWQSLPTP